MDSRDFACVVLPDLDYDAQLISIRHLLRIHEDVDKEFDREIEKIKQFSRQNRKLGDDQELLEWEERLHASIYQSAAHSMSAVGMLAPLIESIFDQAFHGIHKKIFTEDQNSSSHMRWEQSCTDKWDCHFVWEKGRRKKDLVRGIIQLSEATGLKPFLPHDIELVLKVLFAYRNKMFHWGFEWPIEERVRFWSRIQNENWPKSWLEKATSGDKPWIIYLSGEFIQHCTETIERLIDSLGEFVCEKSRLSK